MSIYKVSLFSFIYIFSSQEIFGFSVYISPFKCKTGAYRKTSFIYPWTNKFFTVSTDNFLNKKDVFIKFSGTNGAVVPGKKRMNLFKKFENKIFLKAKTQLKMIISSGFPKVPYRMPGTSAAEWIDIYNRLYRERIILIGREIDEDLVNEVIGILLYLDSEDNTKPIHLYLNSNGGSIVAGLALYDTIQQINSEITTTNVGLCASMASFILSGGTKGKRFALKNSRILIHQPFALIETAQAEDIKIETKQILKIKNNIVNMYSIMTGQPVNRVSKDMERNKYMSAEEAKEYGLIDHIIEKH